MTDQFITYQSANAPTNKQWAAYSTKLDGLIAFGPTEEAAIAGVREFLGKRLANIPAAEEPISEAPSGFGEWGRGKSNIGKVWMHHPDNGFARVALTEISLYEGNGYVRKGPRSK